MYPAGHGSTVLYHIQKAAQLKYISIRASIPLANLDEENQLLWFKNRINQLINMTFWPTKYFQFRKVRSEKTVSVAGKYYVNAC